MRYLTKIAVFAVAGCFAVTLAAASVPRPSVRVSANDVRTAAAMDDVRFESASAQLSSATTLSLTHLAEFLGAHHEFSVLLEGHTDSVGSDERNFSLSRKRATAVKEYLVARGIDPARLQTQGVGESDPIRSNSTEPGRQENRNVAIVFQQTVLIATLLCAPSRTCETAGQTASPPPSPRRRF